jgi:hypothetical protein
MKDMELFKDFVPQPGAPLYIKMNGHLKFFEKNGIIHVYYGYLPLVQFDPSSWLEKRLAVVRLSDEFQIPYKYIARICGMHRDTVSKLVKTKQFFGLEALCKIDRGPKAPWKIVDEVIEKIKKLVQQNPNIPNKQLVEQMKATGYDVSETSVRRIRKSYCPRLKLKEHLQGEPQTLEQMARVARRIEKIDLPQQQMQLFINELGTHIQTHVPEQYHQQYSNITPSEKKYLAMICKGISCRYAGGLLYNVILNQFQFNEIVENLFNEFYDDSKTGYKLHTIFQTLFLMLPFHFPSIESLKKANQTDFGLVVGHERMPSVKVIHQTLNMLSHLNRASKFMKDFACQFVKTHLIEIGVLYFDEHFLPYYGIEHIPAGFFSQRRLAIGGNHQFWAHDCQGHPFFVITTGAQLKLRDMIPHMIARTQAITGQEELTIVFDRGGYSIELFETIITFKTVTFITWAKYVAQETLNAFPEDDFENFTVTLDTEHIEYKLYETFKVIKEGRTPHNRGRPLKQLKVRMIVLWRVATNKKSAIYTNDFESSKEQLAAPIARRWGAQENIFQKMMRRYNLNYHPGYYLDELIQQPLVVNPKVKELKKQIKALENTILTVKGQLANRFLNLKNANVSIEKYRNRQTRTIPKIEAYQTQLRQLQAELEKLPPMISIVELLAGQKMSQFDLEKKKLYDVIQVVAYNAEQKLLKLLKKHYHNKRDVEQILDKIIHHGGLLKLHDGKLYVLLHPIVTPRYRRAAMNLCDEINRLDPKTNDRFGFPVFFKVRERS